MKINFFCIIIVALLPLGLLAGPDDAGFGVYIAPMLGSGHFGVTAVNMPLVLDSDTVSSSSEISPLSVGASRGASFGGKIGIFYRPDNYERRHRFDLEVQGDFFSNSFDLQRVETDSLYNVSAAIETWKLNGVGMVGRIRWSAEVSERWQPYAHFGYGVNMLTLGDATGVGHGFNVGGGMRVRLCSKYAFYVEYETSPMSTVNFSYSDIGKNTGSLKGNIGVNPGYSQVTVAFEFPISFCVNCEQNSNY